MRHILGKLKFERWTNYAILPLYVWYIQTTTLGGRSPEFTRYRVRQLIFFPRSANLNCIWNVWNQVIVISSIIFSGCASTDKVKRWFLPAFVLVWYLKIASLAHGPNGWVYFYSLCKLQIRSQKCITTIPTMYLHFCTIDSLISDRIVLNFLDRPSTRTNVTTMEADGSSGWFVIVKLRNCLRAPEVLLVPIWKSTSPFWE